jgi:putative acetyltransferase
MGDRIQILPFHPENQEAVKNLILDGLAEHWGQLDPLKNPDLNNISRTYASDHFLVAWDGNTIIGTGALIRRSANTAEIVRMSVAQNARRQGIGRMILVQLIFRAKKAGISRIILETTETWQEVIAFYLKAGFQITHHQDGDVYFEMILSEA